MHNFHLYVKSNVSKYISADLKYHVLYVKIWDLKVQGKAM